MASYRLTCISIKIHLISGTAQCLNDTVVQFNLINCVCEIWTAHQWLTMATVEIVIEKNNFDEMMTLGSS